MLTVFEVAMVVALGAMVVSVLTRLFTGRLRPPRCPHCGGPASRAYPRCRHCGSMPRSEGP